MKLRWPWKRKPKQLALIPQKPMGMRPSFMKDAVTQIAMSGIRGMVALQRKKDQEEVDRYFDQKMELWLIKNREKALNILGVAKPYE